MSKQLTIASDLLSQMPDVDADSPLHQVQEQEEVMRFLPKFTVKQNAFTLKAKDGDIVRDYKSGQFMIHHFHPSNQRVYFGTDFDQTGRNKSGPKCGSNDGIVPDPTAPEPQSERCDTCEHSLSKKCKFKRNLIVSEKVDKGEPMLMLMTANATSMFNRNTEFESKGQQSLTAILSDIKKTGKNIFNFLIGMHIVPNGNCLVKYSTDGVVIDAEDPNLIAHVKTKEALDFAEICRMDFTPHEDSAESTIDKPAPAAINKAEASKPAVDDKTKDAADKAIDADKAEIEAFLKSGKK